MDTRTNDESCEQKGCSEVATAVIFWPGNPPVRVCARCLVTAHAIARAMDFVLTSRDLEGGA